MCYVCVQCTQVLLSTNKMAGDLRTCIQSGNLNKVTFSVMRRILIVAIRWRDKWLSSIGTARSTAAESQHRWERRSTPSWGVVFHPEQQVA